MLKWFEKAHSTTLRDLKKKIDEIDKDFKAAGRPSVSKRWHELHNEIVLSLDEMVERAKYLEESISEFQNRSFLLSKNSNDFDVILSEFNHMESFLRDVRKKVYKFVDPVMVLSDNHVYDSHIFVMVCVVQEYKEHFSRWNWDFTAINEKYLEEHLNDTLKLFKNYLSGKHSYGESLYEDFRTTSFIY
ncbi:hypothetical protein [Microcystis sp.]|uniref:hypothetical protein n=1 Tax=Microcystis sp. TaxID=1127 RepID=UPI00391C995D